MFLFRNGSIASAAWFRLGAACAALGWTATRFVRADTVALWRFDEPADLRPGSILHDAGPDHHSLLLGRGAAIVPGKFGHALRPISPASPASDNAPFAALATRGAPHPRRAPFANVTDSKLNLGPGDWTLEGWLLLDPGAGAEGVLLEIGTGPRGENELVTRLSVLPRENVLVLAGLGPPAADAPAAPVARRIDFANPEGPPGGAATLLIATLAPAGPLPHGTWMHAALVHHAAGTLRLYVDGRLAAVAAADLLALPRGDEGYLSIGRDGRGQRPFPGAIDELRVSDHAVYTADFAPPSGVTVNRPGHVFRLPALMVVAGLAEPGPGLTEAGDRSRRQTPVAAPDFCR